MKKKKFKKIITIAFILFAVVCGYLYAETYPFKPVNTPMIKDETHKYKEKQYEYWLKVL